MAQVQVAMHKGTPTLFLDQRPTFPSYLWTNGPAEEDFEQASAASGYAQAGIHFHTFDVGTYGEPPESLHLDRRPSAPIAVILDDESFFYETLPGLTTP